MNNQCYNKIFDLLNIFFGSLIKAAIIQAILSISIYCLLFATSFSSLLQVLHDDYVYHSFTIILITTISILFFVYSMLHSATRLKCQKSLRIRDLWICASVRITYQQLFNQHVISREHRRKIINWCNENCDGIWINSDDEDNSFYFLKKSDALKFKLFWTGKEDN